MAYVVRLFPPHCSCGIEIGAKQYKVESEIAGGKSFIEALSHMKLNKMCDRKNTFCCPMYFIRSSNIGRFRDDGKHVEFGTPEIKINRTPPPFPNEKKVPITKPLVVEPQIRVVAEEEF